MSINKVILVGNVGSDPVIRLTQTSKKIASFSLATSERWKDKDGVKQEKSEWHNISIMSDGAAKVVESYVKKGSKLYIEGQLQTQEWVDKNGVKRYTTNIVVNGFKGVIQLLDSKTQAAKVSAYDVGYKEHGLKKSNAVDDNNSDDEVPF